ncbi:MAG: serine/threonine protein kinase [Planctomycetia bacterium]|nr:serine/threonine protein kinase [Planctomycetia bacterium]
MGAGDMKTAVQCKKCGKSYSAGVVNNDFQGLCPACVAAFAFEEVSQSPLEAPAPPPSAAPDYEKTTMYLSPGMQFQGVVIEAVLGQGGMGVVYKARQLGLDRPVALKMMSDRLAGDPEFVKRFEKEAKAMAALSHANIVAVYNYGVDNGRCFIVMEYVDGVNLRQILREKKLTPEEGLRIVPQLCDALEYAHGEGVVHRDIKPENILIDRKGRVKITDFGLAKMVEPGRTDHTVTGLVMGTPHYMAPEQVESPKAVDHRADIYSMGVVFYELLTGELPIGRWQLPSQKNGVDARLDQVVLKALERQPDRRYQHASDMKIEVSRVQEFIPVARLASAATLARAAAPQAGAFSIPSPASPNAGWTAPPGIATVRPNTPVNPSRISGWIGTGFGLTIAAVAMAFVGLIVVGASKGGVAIPAMVATFGLAGVLGAFGFLCNTIGLFDILFNAGRRHGFGLAVMTYAMHLLLLGVGVAGFFVAQAPRLVESGSKLPTAVAAPSARPAADALFKGAPFQPAGWAVSPESRSYETPEDLAMLWKLSGLPAQPDVARARRVAYVTPGNGGTIFMTVFEARSRAELGGTIRWVDVPHDATSSGNLLVVFQRSPDVKLQDLRGYDELRTWVDRQLKQGAGR